MKQLHADIGFHIATSGGETFPYVRITDRISGCIILEAQLSFEDYAQAVLTSRHDVPCVIAFNDKGPIGKKRETKHELVWVPHGDYGEKRKEAAREAIAKHEVDGWKGSYEDALNSHRIRRLPAPEGAKPGDGSWYDVGFVRWVRATQEDIEKCAKERF